MEKYVLVTGACINTGVSIVEKFASEGYSVIFTGRKQESVTTAEEQYRDKYPNVNIKGYTLCSLMENQEVDEQGVLNLFKSSEIYDDIYRLYHYQDDVFRLVYFKKREKGFEKIPKIPISDGSQIYDLADYKFTKPFEKVTNDKEIERISLSRTKRKIKEI